MGTFKVEKFSLEKVFQKKPIARTRDFQAEKETFNFDLESSTCGES